jgi:hypothetical protein
MKKAILLASLIAGAFCLQYCSHTKKTEAPVAKVVQVPKLTYEANVKPLLAVKCTPCHFPPKGNKTPYDNYASVKTDIDEIIRRTSLNSGERGFMPMRNPKLSDSSMAVLKQWKADGLLEK